MKTFVILFLTVFLIACNETSTPDEENTFDVPVEENLDLETKAKRHVEAALQIPSTEEYQLDILEQDCNEDAFKDAVILVNRKNKALQDAEFANNTPQRAQSEFLGMYNYLFFYDGAKQKITRPIPFGSSALYPLTVRFEHIFSEDYFDFIVEHRIRDAGYTSYFTVKQNTPIMVFQWKEFDGIRNPNPEVNYFAYGEGKISAAKDILVFEGNFPSPPNPSELALGAKVQKTPKLNYRFYYNPSKGKYVTDDKPKE